VSVCVAAVLARASRACAKSAARRSSSATAAAASSVPAVSSRAEGEEDAGVPGEPSRAGEADPANAPDPNGAPVTTRSASRREGREEPFLTAFAFSSSIPFASVSPPDPDPDPDLGRGVAAGVAGKTRSGPELGPDAETRSTMALSDPPEAPATTPPTARATLAPCPMSCSQGESDAMALSARGAGDAAAAAAAAARSDASASTNKATRLARSRGVGSAADRENPSRRKASSRAEALSPRRMRVCSSARRDARDRHAFAFGQPEPFVFVSGSLVVSPNARRAADSYSATRAGRSRSRTASSVISAMISGGFVKAFVNSPFSSADRGGSGAEPEAARTSSEVPARVSRAAEYSAGTPRISTCGNAVTVACFSAELSRRELLNARRTTRRMCAVSPE